MGQEKGMVLEVKDSIDCSIYNSVKLNPDDSIRLNRNLIRYIRAQYDGFVSEYEDDMEETTLRIKDTIESGEKGFSRKFKSLDGALLEFINKEFSSFKKNLSIIFDIPQIEALKYVTALYGGFIKKLRECGKPPNVHCGRSGNNVRSLGFESDAVVLAILHDVLEDGKGYVNINNVIQDLTRKFGEYIVEMVKVLTNEVNISDNKIENYDQHIKDEVGWCKKNGIYIPLVAKGIGDILDNTITVNSLGIPLRKERFEKNNIYLINTEDIIVPEVVVARYCVNEISKQELIFQIEACKEKPAYKKTGREFKPVYERTGKDFERILGKFDFEIKYLSNETTEKVAFSYNNS